MGLYSEHILPRGIDWVMRKKEFSKLRRRYLQPLRGEVLELGFGSGLNLPHDPDGVTTVDAVLSTWTLCTIPDLPRALAEVRRVLRPGGQLHFLEHGLSADPRVARWQNRLNPLQNRLAGGCHLNRPIAELVTASGMIVGEVESFTMKGPRFASSMFAGAATND